MGRGPVPPPGRQQGQPWVEVRTASELQPRQSSPMGTNAVLPHSQVPPVPMGRKPSLLRWTGYTLSHRVHRPTVSGSPPESTPSRDRLLSGTGRTTGVRRMKLPSGYLRDCCGSDPVRTDVPGTACPGGLPSRGHPPAARFRRRSRGRSGRRRVAARTRCSRRPGGRRSLRSSAPRR